jgi:hypothetical protein
MTRAVQRPPDRPLISTGTQQPQRWPTHGDLTRSVTHAIFYHQRATEALYLLKNDWFTGVYGALVPEIEVRQPYIKHDYFIFSLGSCPSKKW